jgi:hypothetical protein
LAEPLAPPYDGLHPGKQLRFVERLGNEVICTQAEALYFRLRPRQAGENQDRVSLRATRIRRTTSKPSMSGSIRSSTTIS